MENILNRKDDEIERIKESQRLIMNNFNRENNNLNNNYTTNPENNYEKENYNNENYNVNSDEYRNKAGFITNDFRKNEDNENELKKLITGYKSPNYNKSIDNDQIGNNYNDNYSLNNSKNSIKVPGKIFSLKKKI